MISNPISKRRSKQILYNQGVLEKIIMSMEILDWDCYDDVVVEVVDSNVVIKNTSKEN